MNLTPNVVALERYAGPTAAQLMGNESDDLSAIHLDYAKARVLADIDSFVDGLDTFNRSHVESEIVMRVASRLEQADDATVLHALLTATADADIRVCRDLLVARYLHRQDAQVLRLAGQLADECECFEERA